MYNLEFLMCGLHCQIFYTLSLTLKSNAIIEKNIIFSSSARTIRNTLFWLWVKEILRKQMEIKRSAKHKQKMCWNWKLNKKQRLYKKNFWNQKLNFYALFIFKLLFKFSLLNLVKEMLNKLLFIKVFPTHKMWSKLHDGTPA